MTDLLKIMILTNKLDDQKTIKEKLFTYKPICLIVSIKNEFDLLNRIEWFCPDLIIVDQQFCEQLPHSTLEFVKTLLGNIPFVHCLNNNEQKIPHLILKSEKGNYFIQRTELRTILTLVSRIFEQAELDVPGQQRKQFHSQIYLRQYLPSTSVSSTYRFSNLGGVDTDVVCCYETDPATQGRARN